MEHRWKFRVLENGEYVRVSFHSYFTRMFGKCIFYVSIYLRSVTPSFEIRKAKTALSPH
jgi:hypothetical protein